MSNQAAEIKVLKNQIEFVIKRDKKEQEIYDNKIKNHKLKEILCSWCKDRITDLYYYHCNDHKKDFCAYCATGGNPDRIGITRWDRKDKGIMPRCDKINLTDCTLQKKEIFE